MANETHTHTHNFPLLCRPLNQEVSSLLHPFQLTLNLRVFFFPYFLIVGAANTRPDLHATAACQPRLLPMCPAIVLCSKSWSRLIPSRLLLRFVTFIDLLNQVKLIDCCTCSKKRSHNKEKNNINILSHISPQPDYILRSPPCLFLLFFVFYTLFQERLLHNFILF